MEKNSIGYSISIKKATEPDEAYEKSFIDFRTDDFSIKEIIEALEFCRDYNFIQERER